MGHRERQKTVKSVSYIAMADADVARPWAGDVSQWRITWYFPNEEPDILVVRRFANAWGIAQPPAADDEPGWIFTRRDDHWQDLSDGQMVFVAWRDDNGSFVTLQRV